MYIRVVSTFGLSWGVLLGTFVYKFGVARMELLNLLDIFYPEIFGLTLF